MFKKNKKSELGLVESIIIIIVFSVIMVFFVLFISSYSNLSIDDKVLISQINTKKILSNCFSDKYGIIEDKKFNMDNLNSCLLNNDLKDSKGSGSNYLVRVRINERSLYLNNNKEEFKKKGRLCGSVSKISLLCKKEVFPIIFKNSDENEQVRFLIIEQIIS